MKKCIFSTIIIVFSALTVAGQKEASIWYFGNKAGINFNAGSPPSALLNGKMNTNEGCASISDANGNLLFYTDGVKVWNKNHVVMNNGNGLMGDGSSTQSSIITPYVGDNNKYYIFATDGFTCDTLNGPKKKWDGLTYSVVDMTFGGGLGRVVPGSKNIGLVDSTREQITAARHANGIDYWVVTRKHFTNEYYAYLVTCNGVDVANPVITKIGSAANCNTKFTSVGCLKTSPNSDAILSPFANGISELYDFDNATGVLTNARTINTGTTKYFYGASFSPDGKVLYMAGGSALGSMKGFIYRYQRFAPVISTTEIVDTFLGCFIHGIQLGPDGKIYFVHSFNNQEDSLGVIHDPNNYVSPNMQYNYVYLGGKKSTNALPNYFESFFYYNPPNAGNDTLICDGGTAQIGSNPIAGLNYFWTPSSGLNNATTSNPLASPIVTTQYIIGAYNNCDTIYDTVLVTVSPKPVLTISPSYVEVCKGGAAAFTASGATTYQWFPAVGLNSLTGNTVLASPLITEIYSVTGIDNSGCSAIQTATVVVNNLPEVQYTLDAISACDTVCIDAVNTTLNSTSCEWSFGDGNVSSQNNVAHCYTTPGVYTLSLQVTDNKGCISVLEIQDKVEVFASPAASFEMSITEFASINNTINFTNRSTGASAWRWSFGDKNNSTSTSEDTQFSYKEPGTYEVQLIVNNQWGCEDTTTQLLEVGQGFSFYAPNTFTPNGDGLNDVFLPMSMGINEEAFKLMIFDRWGNLIFESTQPSDGWDGKVSGDTDSAKEDVYVWKINLKDKQGERCSYIGHISIIR